MRRDTYKDSYLTVTDIINESGRLQARRLVFRNEFGSVEKEYHRVFEGNGVKDPMNGCGELEQDD